MKSIAKNISDTQIASWILDYKTYGTDSYVYNDRDIFDIVAYSPMAINDTRINADCLEYVVQKNFGLGIWFDNVYGIVYIDAIKDIDRFQDLIADSDALTTILNNSTAMAAVVNSSTAMTAIADSSTAMTAIIANSTALNAVVNSSTAMTAIADSSTAMAAIIANSTIMTAIIANSTALNAVVNSSTAMSIVANSAYTLNAICKNSTARTIFLHSPYRDIYYDAIFGALNNTTYFNMFNSGTDKYYQLNIENSTLYVNGANPISTSGPIGPDDCFILVFYYGGQYYSGYGESSLKALQTNEYITQNDSNIHYINIVIPGGIIVYNTSIKYYLFTAK